MFINIAHIYCKILMRFTVKQQVQQSPSHCNRLQDYKNNDNIVTLIRNKFATFFNSLNYGLFIGENIHGGG